MDVPDAYFITWTTYGSWLPGDPRGWRKWHAGAKPPQPQLEAWCRGKMKSAAVVLTPAHREAVEAVCRQHADIRGWALHAVHARSNHVHLAVSAPEQPTKVRDQFKANTTRTLRQPPRAMTAPKIWTRGGDIAFVDGVEALEQVVWYIVEGQDIP